MKLKVSEHQLQTLLKNYLEAKGWFVLRLNSVAIRTDKGNMVRMARAGTPDLMAFKMDVHPLASGRFNALRLVFIEVKVPGNKPTYAQEQMMKELEEKGAGCLVVHSLEELEEQLL